jgi:SagB-type dehydrogenase family enzyme
MENNLISLPRVKFTGKTSVEEALYKRRSIRHFLDKTISLPEISRVLWAAQGINAKYGKRTAPSAGATYPLEIYLNVSNVESLSPGIYRYYMAKHALYKLIQEDQKSAFTSAALGQSFIEQAAAIIIITAIFERTTNRYGKRGIQYIHQEAGAAAQNIHLQVVSLNIGTVMVGAFHEDRVKEIMNFPANEQPLLLMPLGKIK